MTRTLLSLTALAAVALAPSPASAAAKLARGRAIILSPLTLAKADDLNFGTVIAPTAANGTIYIDPDTGTPSYTGVSPVTSFPTLRGRFVGAGTPGQGVDLTFAPPTTLDKGAQSIPVALELDQAGSLSRSVGALQSYEIFIGGTVTIPANQPDGTYSGMFRITATYQ